MISKLFDKAYKPEFARRLREQFEIWQFDPRNRVPDKKCTVHKKMRGKNRSEFAALVNEKVAELTNGSIKTNLGQDAFSRYMNPHNEMIPSRPVFAAICAVLKCNPSVLLPVDAFSDKYGYNRDCTRGMIADKEKLAEEIGLNETFVKWVSGLEKYRSEFPVFRMIRPNYAKKTPAYIRMDPPPAVDVDSIFQVKYHGQTITLHDNDIRFLKDLQDEVAKFIAEKMEEKQKEYDEEFEALPPVSEDERMAELLFGGLQSANKEVDKNGNVWYGT